MKIFEKGDLNGVLRCASGAVFAWKMWPGVIWVQVHDPRIAKLLLRRKDCRVVAKGIEGRYLRTFEFNGKELAWAEKLIRRLESISTAFSEPASPGARLGKRAGRKDGAWA
jgi:hypothetical protein